MRATLKPSEQETDTTEKVIEAKMDSKQMDNITNKDDLLAEFDPNDKGKTVQ